VQYSKRRRVPLRLCRTDTKKTAPELKQHWSEQSGAQCTTRTVRGQLLKHGFNSCIERKKASDNGKQRRARFLWGEEHRQRAKIGQRLYGQMSPASSYIQPEQMSESEGDVGKNMCLLELLQL